MKKVILSIDTSRYDELVVSLEMDGKKKVIKKDFDFRKSQGVLPLIEQIVKDEGLNLSDLTGLEVNTGPGSFTGLRVGAAIANTLGIVLQIPINNLPVGQQVIPFYK